ncbi:MAG: hypothetical protein ACYS0F_06570 [Planctomycetota bacterium]|jgi:hypothetical protein
MRIFLLIFLVFLLPAAVYWASTGGGDPVDVAQRFLYQLGQLKGEETPKAEEPEPEPEEEEEDKPEPSKEPEEEKRPEPTAADPDALYRQGAFVQAAEAATEESLRTLALLGAAFAKAFPPPGEPYMVVELTGGSKHEGFALEAIGEVRLMQPTGSAIGLPASMIVSKRELSAEEAAERTLARIEREAASGDMRKLFRATAAAFRVGHPEAAAPLLERIVGAEAQSVLKAITKDVPAEAKDELFRAYSDAAIARKAPAKPVTVVQRDRPRRDTPLKADGSRTKLNGGRKKRTEVKDAEAKKFMSKARPFRQEGEALYKKILAGGLAKADPDDIENAIRKYNAAMTLYEKAFEIEDNDTIYALLTGCSKQLFRLRFWKEQVGTR